MLVEHRTYTVRPGTMKLQMDLYAEHGLEPQRRHLGAPLAFLMTETGELNTYIHLWVFKDAADREAKRAALARDSGWLAYLEKAGKAGYVTRQESRLMTPAPFAPIADAFTSSQA